MTMMVNYSNSPKTYLGGHAGITHSDMGALKWAVEKFGVKSMIDIGCGPGKQVVYAKELGLRAVGIDGDIMLQTAEYSLLKDETILHDYCDGAYWDLDDVPRFDLAWSVEFLEHVEEKYMLNYMHTFQRCDYVICTASIEEQGHHHVNVQGEEYWIQKFLNFGFFYEEELTRELKENSWMHRVELEQGDVIGSGKEFIQETGRVFSNMWPEGFDNEAFERVQKQLNDFDPLWFI